MTYHDLIEQKYGKWYSLTKAVLYSYSKMLNERDEADVDRLVPHIAKLLNVAGGGNLLHKTGLVVKNPDGKRGLYRLDLEVAEAWLRGEGLVQRGIYIQSDPRIEHEQGVLEDEVDADEVAAKPDQEFPYEIGDSE
ncbi:hypothetical protein [Nocardioides antri]|uniref:Uncharacterized protein n=1 Tax=Nocardioides antri TaxID=2607659 RepID=A0A5B1LTW0_9ACTN|nr:hypothetical protein [Nocardioides antri]KAA1424325.1 hypothetical protein F0U47_19010 [Nocardioides antri]